MRTAVYLAVLVCVVSLCGCDKSSPPMATPAPAATQPAYVPEPPPTPVAPPERTRVMPDGTIEVAAGQPVEVTVKRAGQYQGQILSHNETAKAAGSNLDFSGEKIGAELAQGAPGAGLGCGLGARAVYLRIDFPFESKNSSTTSLVGLAFSE